MTLREKLQLDITPEKLHGLADALGPGSIGTFVVREVLNKEQLALMQNEIFNPELVAWRDNHDSFVNKRGLTVIENHTTCALKLHKGDHRMVERVPHMRALAQNIETVIRDLAPLFPSLHNWRADEMSLHRYDNPDVSLSFHQDNLRFTGLIAVLALEGENDLAILDDQGETHRLPIYPGDLNLTRATELYDVPPVDGKPVNLCPDHAVVNLRTPFKTSFIVRANNRPNDLVPGFEYANWDGQPS
jgi:hypothetical protein